MNRRNFLTALGAGAIAAATGSLANEVGAQSGATAASRRTPKRKNQPNIIFILADDLGYGDLSCYGQQKFQTPNIDRLASEGKRFTQAYAGSTVCAPSRCSLLTGMHQGHARVRGNIEGGDLPLRSEDLTIAEILQKKGYKTAIFGKWGLGFTETTGAPNKKGFDEFLGYTDHVHAHHYYTDYLWRNDQKIAVDKTKYTHDIFIEEALNFIRANRNNPFFLYLPVTIPHAAVAVPEDSLAEFRGKFPEKPFPGNKYYTPQATPHAAYAAMVTRLDRSVGQITTLLDELKLDENTLVLFSSDNGPSVEGGSDPKFFQNTAGLRGIKRDLYEGGIRVPLIARWRGRIKPGTSDLTVAFWDVMPTLAEIANAPVPKTTDGISIVPTLFDKGRQRRHEYLYWEFYERGFQQAVRLDDWKGLRLKKDQPPELYNLRTDREEKINVAAQNPQIVQKIEEIMRRAHVPSAEFAKTAKSSSD